VLVEVFKISSRFAAQVSRDPLGRKHEGDATRMSKAQLGEEPRRKSPPPKSELVKPESNWVQKYAPTLIAVISVILNFVIVIYNVWPNYSAEFISPELCFDSRALSDSSYADSLSVHFQLYNAGNKPLSFYSFKVDIEDPQDTTLAAITEVISAPGLLVPGEIRECYLRIRVFRVWNRQSTRPLFYSPPRSQGFQEWANVTRQIGVNRIVLPLSHPIKLLIRVEHSGHKSIETRTQLSGLTPIVVPTARGSYP
jgi:hypothetical protein